MRNFAKTIFSLFLACVLIGCHENKTPTKTVGIIEPLEHTAMQEIASGFSETLSQQYHQPVTIKVENAQGDPNLTRAIIQHMRDAHYDVILPIGVDTTQMTLSMVHEQSIVSLASDITDTTRKQLQPCNVVSVHDEISSAKLLAFIHLVYPQLTELTLIHSAGNKVLPEVQDTVAIGKKYGITIKPIMVSTLPELYSTVQALPSSTQGLFVLKDSAIVSGISTLVQVATKQQIPLITSDQGSVENGAGLALGVHEREIGVQGAKLALQILQGKFACELPNVDMNNLTVFINPKTLQQMGQTTEAIQQAASQLHYSIEVIGQSPVARK